MSERFTSSNGGTVEMLGDRRMIVTDTNEHKLNENASVKSHSSWLDPAQIETLREFFQHERDQELGRWRWPEDPDFVLYHYGEGRDYVEVFWERTGTARTVYRGDESGNSSAFMRAARSYFAAHPEPKPWQDAKPGEVWVLRTAGVDDRWNPTSFWVVERDGYIEFVPVEPGYSVSYLGVNAAAIEGGRRIWPEVSDVA